MHQEIIGDSPIGVLGASYLGFLRCLLSTGEWDCWGRMGLEEGIGCGGARRPNPRCKTQQKFNWSAGMDSKGGIFNSA
jgi:hypothetical protein